MSFVHPAPGGAGARQIGVGEWLVRTLRDFAGLFENTAPVARNDALVVVALVAILAVAVGVRFWGLGDVGLHGDEETMAMPTMHLVEHGEPLLPSGMYYPRAVGQLYLMAASVQVFGESEWAFRLPSALCGVLLVLLAFAAGARFLHPVWNLAFTAMIALLPEFIVDAQTARMYGFLVTAVAAYLLLLFKWEKTDQHLYLVAAVAVLAVGIQFHTLAVFAAFMVFFPALVRGERHKFLLGMVAFALIVASYFGVDQWVVSHYPETREVGGGDGGAHGPKAANAIPALGVIGVAIAAVVATAVAAFLVRYVKGRVASNVAGALLALGLLAQAAFSYHAAVLLIAAGLVVAFRHGEVGISRLLFLGLVSGVIATVQIYVLHDNGVGSLRQMIGALTGRPSVWPMLAIAEYSRAAALVLGAAVVAGVWRLAKRRPLPDFLLLMVLGVWLPLLLVGLFAWSVPLRYTAAQVFPMLLAAFAAAQWFLMPGAARRVGSASGWQVATAAVVCIVMVNPMAFARIVHTGYATNPDHKGAAAFIMQQRPGPKDIVIAEDVLEQTYYLGHVDYWLQARDVASSFVQTLDGRLVDFYTNTPLIGTAADLEQVIAQPGRGAIYIIGSGENQEDGRRGVRGPGLAAMLESSRFEVIFRGRDNLTTILKMPAPGGEPVSHE